MTKHDLPLITIAITCYNAQDTIRRAVLSAIRQTWPNREIIIIDDCSTDESWYVIQKLIREFPEVHAIRHERNRGYPAALNALVTEARGEFTAFFDDDDESVASRLEQQYKRITGYEKAHGNAAVLCYSNRDVVHVGETKPNFQRFGIGRTAPEPHGAIVAGYVLGLIANKHFCWGMFGSCTIMARTASFRTLGGLDEQFRRGAELDFAVRAACKDAHFISVDLPLITQYLTDTPDKAGNIELRYQLLLIRKHKAYLDSRRAYRGAIANAHARFHHNKRRYWRALALMLFPWRISWEWLMNRKRRVPAMVGI